MSSSADDIITASIPDFCRLSGIRRSMTYVLLDEGKLKAVKVGKRRLIVLDSWRRLVEEQLAAQQEEAAAEARPRPRGRPRSNPHLMTEKKRASPP
jgi:hypothetical protein